MIFLFWPLQNVKSATILHNFNLTKLEIPHFFTILIPFPSLSIHSIFLHTSFTDISIRVFAFDCLFRPRLPNLEYWISSEIMEAGRVDQEEWCPALHRLEAWTNFWLQQEAKVSQSGVCEYPCPGILSSLKWLPRGFQAQRGPSSISWII